METASKKLGRIGEGLACRRLWDQGYKILLKNYSCGLGEIDLIAKENGALVFIEIKTRSSDAMGAPAESLTFQKRRQITKVAQYYLKRYGIKEVSCRFDVVSVIVSPGQDPEIEVLKDAFSAEA